MTPEDNSKNIKKMTELEKAYAYIQMLKQEGKLDDRVISELMSMYTISSEDATDLLEKFKQSDEYKSAVSSTIKEKSILLIMSLAIGGCFLYAATSRSGSIAFGLHAYFFLAAAVGLVTYLGKLLIERFALDKQYPWLQNKILPFVLLAFAILCFTQYQLQYKTYLYNKADFPRKIDGVLVSNFKEVEYGSKSRGYYYEFSLDYYYLPLRWYDVEHKYSFNSKMYPPTFFKKGDSITVFASNYNDKGFIEVGDLEKNGVGVMNIEERNGKAKERATKQRNLIGYLFLGSLILFSFVQINENRKIV